MVAEFPELVYTILKYFQMILYLTLNCDNQTAVEVSDIEMIAMIFNKTDTTWMWYINYW
jgi:hypothetical protein